MKTLLIILFFSINSFAQELPVNFKIEQLYSELNYARTNQKQYGKQHRLKLKNRKANSFKKNIKLEQKAQQYADYMASTNRFRHSRMNYNESIAYNYYEPHKLIFQLIKDDGVPDLGHRKHLLSYDNKNTQVGIGIANNVKTGRYYICVLTSD